jgi:hypothetical protein
VRAIWVAHVAICGADGTRQAKIDFQIGIVPADGKDNGDIGYVVVLGSFSDKSVLAC